MDKSEFIKNLQLRLKILEKEQQFLTQLLVFYNGTPSQSAKPIIKAIKQSSVRMRCLRFFQNNPNSVLTLKGLISALKTTPPTQISNALTLLVKSGHIRRVRVGQYQLKEGRKQA